MSSWTPGPWEVRRWGTNDEPWPFNRVSIGPKDRGTVTAVVISPKYADVNDEANYRLIAAAPEMAEALERALNHLQFNAWKGDPKNDKRFAAAEELRALLSRIDPPLAQEEGS